MSETEKPHAADLGEVGVVSISVDVEPEIAASILPGELVTFLLGGWVFTGRVISVAARNVLLDTDGRSVALGEAM